MFVKVKNIIILLLSVLTASCANTSLIDSWKKTEHAGFIKHPMIIGVSDSQQTRQIYEKHFVAELKKKNITATASYTLINSKQKIDRETVVEAIRDTEIDAVLVTYLVSADSTLKHRDSPIGNTYSGSADNNQISATIISNRGRSRSEEVVVLKNDVYDVRSKSLVWSAQTKAVGPESIDEVVTDVTQLLIDAMFSDNLLK